MGTTGDDGTIRLGTQGTQTATYIAGISGKAMTGADVVVSSTGRLGVLPSSARYKKDIQPLNETSNKLWQLRPVTFRYRQDPSQRQYGLIAEQVAKVYPELVVRGGKGEIESVQYRKSGWLAPARRRTVISTGSANLLSATSSLTGAWRVNSSNSTPNNSRNSAAAALLSRLLTVPALVLLHLYALWNAGVAGIASRVLHHTSWLGTRGGHG
jgi:hypothetical protein